MREFLMSIFGNRHDEEPVPEQVEPEDFDEVEADSEHAVDLPGELLGTEEPISTGVQEPEPEAGEPEAPARTSSDIGPYRPDAEEVVARALQELGHDSLGDFQASQGVRVTGEMGPVTWRLLRRAYRQT
jgi:hypothetical protein